MHILNLCGFTLTCGCTRAGQLLDLSCGAQVLLSAGKVIPGSQLRTLA